MQSIVPAVACLAVYAAGYFLYARYLGRRVFGLSADRVTPAHALEDGVDYVPTPRWVLFGHHYASITGLAPMLGPAVAVIWGWVPAMVWVVVGAVFVGCVHDLGALVISLRARGMSIGKVAEGVIGRRAKTLFHLVIFFGIGLAMGVFVLILGMLLSLELAPGRPGYPQAVLPSAGLMVLAAIIGYLTYRRKLPLGPLTVAAFILMLGLVAAGEKLPTLGLPQAAWPSGRGWMGILLGYAFLASVLPVWSLLQPRDFINSLLLYLGLAGCFAGFFVLGPAFDAPAVNLHPEGAPPLFPFVFIVIACGAASGFHALVASGTTAKQLDKETDATFVGYGGMIGESLLGLLAVLACTAGFAGSELWHKHYATWAAAGGSGNLAVKIDAFIGGCTRFLGALGIPPEIAASFMAVVVVSFALTTLDSATRLLRYNIEEMSQTLRLDRVIGNRYVASLLAVGTIAFFAFYRVHAADGSSRPAGLMLWALFGTTNQLLAGLALLVVTIYLKQRRRPWWLTGIPMAFLLVSTLVAMVQNLLAYARAEQTALVVVGGTLLALAVWLVVEGALCLRRPHREDDLEIRGIACRNAERGTRRRHA